jgi:hypothetical protein
MDTKSRAWLQVTTIWLEQSVMDRLRLDRRHGLDSM